MPRQIEGAGAAADAGKAVGQDAAGEEVAEFLFHEVWQASALGALGCLAEKSFRVLADHRDCCPPFLGVGVTCSVLGCSSFRSSLPR
jgi:hypothetical protein